MTQADDNGTSDPPSVILGTSPTAGSPFMAPRRRVRRFNGVERALHWTFAGLFLLLLATGLALFHPQWRNWNIGGLKVIKEIHLTLGILFVLLPATVAAWDGWQSLSYDSRHLLCWDGRDWRWLVALIGRPGKAPRPGRFNAGQKLNGVYIILVAGGLVITGGLIWPDRLLDPVTRALLFGVHDLLMLASLPAIGLHLLLALVVPATRPALPGVISGAVDATWHAAHYPDDPGPPVVR